MKKGAEVLILQVELDDGRKGKINIHEFDQPEDLARDFCKKFKLPRKIEKSLVQTIDENIQALIQQEASVKAETFQLQESTTSVTPKPLLPSSIQQTEFFREKKFLQFFKALNPNSKGLISYQTIDMAFLPPKIYEILEPVIEQLYQSLQAINYQQFRRSMECLLSYLSEADREILFQSPKKVRKPGFSTYERLTMRKFLTESKLKQLRQEKMREELIECTFQPSIYSRVNK